MRTYPIPMVPGPVKVPVEVLAAMQVDYGSADLESEFLDLYNQTEENLKTIYGTNSQIVIQTGEGMIALWGALKSCLLPRERVLAISTGVFGYGIGEMAKSVGAEVKTIGLPYDQTIHNYAEIEQAIIDFQPKMITVVHCETPSGTLNPLDEVGRLKKKYSVPLLYVDAVASAGGVPVLSDEWNIDLALGGSQKVLSVPPSMAFLTVSDTAWEIIEKVNYVGYDALKPFRTAQKDFYFPYTPDWHGMAALYTGTKILLDEGLDRVFARHEQVAQFCRNRLVEIGLKIYPAVGAISSPTVTAVNLPQGFTWTELDAAFRERGLVVGGSYGPLAGKVFRLGHMGSQADLELVKNALDVIEDVVNSRK